MDGFRVGKIREKLGHRWGTGRMVVTPPIRCRGGALWTTCLPSSWGRAGQFRSQKGRLQFVTPRETRVSSLTPDSLTPFGTCRGAK